LTLTALNAALAVIARPKHSPLSDQGIQYARDGVHRSAPSRRVAISMAEMGEARPRTAMPSGLDAATIKKRRWTCPDYLDFADAYHQIGRFLEDVYMRKRIHFVSRLLDPDRVREPVVCSHQATGTTID